MEERTEDKEERVKESRRMERMPEEEKGDVRRKGKWWRTDSKEGRREEEKETRRN